MEQLSLTLWLTDALAAERAATEYQADHKPVASVTHSRKPAPRKLMAAESAKDEMAWPGIDPALVAVNCPGRKNHPSRICSVCERPAVLATVHEDCEHSCSWCVIHWQVLQEIRNPKAPPLAVIPVRAGRAMPQALAPVQARARRADEPPPHDGTMPPTPGCHESFVVAIA